MADTWRKKPITFSRSDPERAAQTIGIPDMLYSSAWGEIETEWAILRDLRGGRCIAVQADLADPSSRARILEEILHTLGRIGKSKPLFGSGK